MIPYGRQDINDEDIKAVIEVLKSDFLTQGPAVPAFEKSIIQYCGCEYAVAVNSATSALHIACLALGIGKDDIVWTSPISFVASANCALYCGADVDFVDIDPVSYNLSVVRLEEKLEHAKKENKLPKAIIPVHFCGQPCDMSSIFKLSKQYGFKIIEDASHAIGGKYKGEPIGNCKYSDITVFSFHPVKIITTGEGGMAVTNNLELANKMQSLRSHGITRDPDKMTHLPDGQWYYQQTELGFNYRMTDIQAALGNSQMSRLDEFVAKRHELCDRYNHLLSSLPIVLPFQNGDGYSGMHLYVIRLKLNEMHISHKQVFDNLRKMGVGVNLHYIPIHTQPYYLKMGFKRGDFPQSETYYSEAISLPMYPGLASDDQMRVVQSLNSVLQRK